MRSKTGLGRPLSGGDHRKMEVDMKKNLLSLIGLSVCAAALGAASLPARAAEDAPAATAITKIQRVSVNAKGTQTDTGAFYPVFSPDGTKVLFASSATTLMVGGGDSQLYIKTLASGLLRRVSTTSAGKAGNGDVWDERAVFSPDGTKVLFTSDATNLVPGDTNGTADVFEKNLTTGAIRRLSTTSSGGQANSESYSARYSPDGKRVVFVSAATNLVANDTNGVEDLFVKNLATGTVQRVSLTYDRKQIDAWADWPSFSPDGKKIVFTSAATNLVPGDTNGNPDIFVRDLTTGAVARTNVSKMGVQSNGYDDLPAIFHPNGVEVVFNSDGTKLIAKDTNGARDVFSKSLTTGAVKRLSTTSSGGEIPVPSAHGVLDASGEILAFEVLPLIVDARLDRPRDRRHVARPTATITDGGVFVKNLATGTLVRVSTTVAGVAGNGSSRDADVSANGKLVAFSSDSTNLVPGDTNGVPDVFVVTLK